MYVCMCNGFTDRCVDRAIDAGAKSICDVYSHLGCQPQCGTCMTTIGEQLTERSQSTPLVLSDAA